VIGAPIGDLASLLDPGPAATALAAGALALMVIGAAGTIASGRWYWRSVLVVGALVWPLPDHAWQGPVILRFGFGHGMHVSDLLSVAALIVAAMSWPRSRRRSSVDR